MPALVAGIHVFSSRKNVDGRDKPGQARPWQPGTVWLASGSAI